MRWILEAVRNNKKKFEVGQEVIYKNDPKALTIIVEVLNKDFYKINSSGQVFITNVKNLV